MSTTARIFGIETEYGLSIGDTPLEDLVSQSHAIVKSCEGPFVDRWDYSSEDPRRDLRGYQVRRLSRDPRDVLLDARGPRYHSLAEEHASRILVNGARLYNDHGHPEYSTPECMSLAELVAHDRAGEHVVMRAAQLYEESTRRAVTVYKNNTDFHGASYGTHESYLMRRDVPVERLLHVLLPFLATRQVFAGSGKVGSDRNPREGFVYQLSQRAEFVDVVASVDTQYRRPLFNTRDEPHAQPDRYRRLHVIIGDANLSEWATAMKVGTLALVLDLAESGWTPPFELADPVKAVRAVACDVTLRAPVVTVRHGGRSPRDITALDVQRLYLEAVAQVPSSLPERDWVISEWAKVLDDLATDIWLAADRVDWVAKLWAIEHFKSTFEGSGVHLDELRSLDLAYHDLEPKNGLFPAVAEELGMRRVIDDEMLADAIRVPPHSSRAFIRGHFVKQWQASVISMSWSAIGFRYGNEGFVFDMNTLVDRDLTEENKALDQMQTLDETVQHLVNYQEAAALP